MNTLSLYDDYIDYLASEAPKEDCIPPDGCYWCGDPHPTASCPNEELREAAFDHLIEIEHLETEFDDLIEI